VAPHFLFTGQSPSTPFAQTALPQPTLSVPTTESLQSGLSGASFVPASSFGTVSSPHLCETIQYNAPDTLHSHINLRNVIVPCTTRPSRGTKCSICLVTMYASDLLATLQACGHTFHDACLHSSLLHSSKCPICRSTVGNVQGKMPSGTMTVTVSPSITCDGFASGTIVISYSIPSAIQKSYHDNPGVAHDAALRTAYLPNSPDGQMLLKRLKFAFRHDLTFTVGRSLTTGCDNSVTWTSIHHKKSPNGGHQAHGFPDAGYFVNCNDDRDALGVPTAHKCP
jgi:deltex-like protein